jgi:hypothetical protein
VESKGARIAWLDDSLMKAIKRLPEAPTPYGASHLVFLDYNKGYGITSVDMGHFHELQYIQPTEEQQDPQTGQVIPGNPGGWQMSPGPDGHVHEPQFLDLPKTERKQKPETEEQVIGEVVQLFRRWVDNEKLSIDAGREAEDFYIGKQWSDSERSKLEENSRACLVLNQIDQAIDTLSGYERQERTEIRLLPEESTDQRAADLYNILIKHILDKCGFWQEKSLAFEDVCIPGRGAWNIRVDFSEDLAGDIIVERYPWDQFVYGPHEKPDASDAEGMIKYRWYSPARAKMLWPDFADKIDEMMTVPQNLAGDGIMVEQTEPGVLGASLPTLTTLSRELLNTVIDVERKNILLLECHRYTYIQVPVVVNAGLDFYENAWQWSKEDLAAARTIQGFTVVDRSVRKVRITKLLGNQLVADDNPANLPSDKIHFVPIYAKRRKGMFWGKVEGLKDLQREVNKRASQAIDIGNTMAAYNWFIDSETFPANEKQRFLEHSSTPGSVFEVNSTNKIPVQTSGTKFPSEIVQLMQLSLQQIKERTNITVDNAGANTSGAAILQQQKLKLLGNEFLFDSMTGAIQRLGKLLIPLVKRYYPAERVMRIVKASNSKQPQTAGGEPVSEFTDDEIIQILEAADLEKFDLIVSESSFSPSARLSIFLILTSLREKGVDIPPEMIIQFADMPDAEKQNLIQRLQAQAEAQGQAQQQAQDAEVEKTLVAKNIIPPSVAERFGIPQQVPGQPMATGVEEGAPQQMPMQPQSQAVPQEQSLPQFHINIQPPEVAVPAVNVAIDGRRPGKRKIVTKKLPDGSFFTEEQQD